MMKACPNRTRFLHTKERNRINGKNHRRKDKTSTSIKIATDSIQVKGKNMKGARTAAVNTNTDNFTIKRLSQNTTYYVRIRAFKRASNGVRYYSDWGSVKAVTVK